MNQREVSALIDLIEDPDDGVFSQVRERILELGMDIVPQLETAWEESEHGVFYRNRIEDLLHNIHLEDVFKKLQAWNQTKDQDLLEGALLICRYRYAELDDTQVLRRLQTIRQDAWLGLTPDLTAFEKVRILNQVIFEQHGFNGNRENYNAPQNSFLNEVIQKKKGNPLTLAIIYQVIAQQLNLPIFGVNLPNHFILAYMDKEGVDKEAGALFYINPYSQGDILTTAEIDQFVARLKLDKDPSFYKPCSTRAMVMRILNNLAHAYAKNEDEERASDIAYLKKAILDSPRPKKRDL